MRQSSIDWDMFILTSLVQLKVIFNGKLVLKCYYTRTSEDLRVIVCLCELATKLVVKGQCYLMHMKPKLCKVPCTRDVSHNFS